MYPANEFCRSVFYNIPVFMLVVLSFCPKDEELAFRNAQLIARLKNSRSHKFVLTYDSRCNPDRFKKVLPIIGETKVIDRDNRWPNSCNTMFAEAARYVEWAFTKELAWLFLEPDAIPIKDYWLDKIEAEYTRTKKKFMGAKVSAWQTCPEHLSGVAVYPNPLVLYAGLMVMSAGEDVPFDVVDDTVATQSLFTDLIQNKGRRLQRVNDRWIAVDEEVKFDTWDEFYQIATKECVLFHADKRGRLIDLQSGHGGDAPATSVPEPARLSTTDESPKPGLLSLKERRQVQAAKMRAAKAAKRKFKPLDGTENPKNLEELLQIMGDKMRMNGEPWDDKFQSLGEINFLCQRLYRYCDAPRHISRVREELRKVGVIR